MKKSINLNGVKTKVEFTTSYANNNNEVTKTNKGVNFTYNTNTVNGIVRETKIYFNYFNIEIFTINGKYYKTEAHVTYKKNKFNSIPDSSYYYIVNGQRLADNHKKVIEFLLK